MSYAKYAIIGGGPAAFSAIDTINKFDKQEEIALIGAENHLPYYRPLMPNYLAGWTAREKLYMRPEDFYARSNVRFINGKAIQVNGRHNLLTYEKSENDVKAPAEEELKFEKLLLATGADPVQPNIPGLENPGTYFLRTINDADNIGRRAREAKRAVMLGGGLVSLKTAQALQALGLEVVLIISSNRVFSQMLDWQGGELLAHHLKKEGIKIFFQNEADFIHSNRSGVKKVTLADGQELEAEMVVVGKGVEPAVSFLEGSDVEFAEGIPVNEKLQTNLPHVYAAGDVTLTQDLLFNKPALHPFWPKATDQGAVAGANMAGKELTYSGCMAMNATEIFGLPVIAAGLAWAEKEEDFPGEIYRPLYLDSPPSYTKIVLKDDRLVGYIIIGENRKAGILTNLIMSQQLLSPYRKNRLINGEVVYL